MKIFKNKKIIAIAVATCLILSSGAVIYGLVDNNSNDDKKVEKKQEGKKRSFSFNGLADINQILKPANNNITKEDNKNIEKENEDKINKKAETVEVTTDVTSKIKDTKGKKGDEFVGKYSDISIGASGAPIDYSMIITRTEKGQNLIHSLIAEGFIDKYKIPLDQVNTWKPRKINWFKKMTSTKINK